MSVKQIWPPSPTVTALSKEISLDYGRTVINTETFAFV